MKTKTVVSEYEKEVFKNEEGYLHHEISEGWWLEEGVRNYSFTDDIFKAYDVTHYDKDEIPKYVEVTHEEEGQEMKNRKQMCEILKGEFIKVKIKTTKIIEWEELV